MNWSRASELQERSITAPTMRASDQKGAGPPAAVTAFFGARLPERMMFGIWVAMKNAPKKPGTRNAMVPRKPNQVRNAVMIIGPSAHPDVPPTVYIESEILRTRGSLTRAALEAPIGWNAPEP